jgi:hypothetical protein
MRTYCVDFDDLYDGVADRSLDILQGLKDRYPGFRATLFTIPNRTSEATIEKFKPHTWLALAPHGWHHTRGECLTWAFPEAFDKLTRARDKGIDAPAFRAPAWFINRTTYEACRDLNLTICDHSDNYLHVPHTQVYRYNDPAFRAPKVESVHGHLTQCAVDNFIGDMLADERLSFANESKFVYPWQAAKTVGEKP